MRVAFADQILPLPARPLGVLFLDRRDRDHPAMAAFTAQPSQEHAHQHGGVEPICLGPLVLTRDRDAGRMDNVHLDTVPGQPSCQPEPVPPGFEGDGDARDGATAPGCLVAPAVQQAQQGRFVWRDLLQRLPFDSRNARENQPALVAELDDSNQTEFYLGGS